MTPPPPTPAEPSSSLPAAVLWDMDGTLVDSEPYWMDAETQLVEEWGGTWTHEDAMQCVGSGLERSALIIQSRGVELSVDEIIATMTDRVLTRIRQEVPWRPGARELLQSIKAAGVPTALVTMSIGRMARHVAASLGFDGFDVVVPGDEVEHPKPHPAPYLRAAELLGVDIRDCVALEDSEPGAASAVAAGARVVAVPLHIPLPPSSRYELRDTLVGVTVADLPTGVRTP